MTSTAAPPASADVTSLHTYPFASDPEFQAGLTQILKQREELEDVSPPSAQEVLALDLQARCFYYSRKQDINPPIKPSEYQAWLQDQGYELNSATEQLSRQASATQVKNARGEASTETVAALVEPAYPTNFAHIVELVTTGQLVPGIEEVPDTLLAGQERPSAAAKRRKPWEKDYTQSGI